MSWRILKQRLCKACKGLISPCKHAGKHAGKHKNLTTAYCIRDTQSTASIYIRVSDGRGQQHRFNTGHRLTKTSNWNCKTQSVRSVACESYDLINLQLKRLKAAIEAKAVEAKARGQVRGKAFYADLLESFSVFEEAQAPKRAVHWTLSQAVTEFIHHAEVTNSPHTGRRLKASTLDTYRDSKRHLEGIELGEVPVSVIDMEWYHAFTQRSEDGGRGRKPLSC